MKELNTVITILKEVAFASEIQSEFMYSDQN